MSHISRNLKNFENDLHGLQVVGYIPTIVGFENNTGDLEREFELLIELATFDSEVCVQDQWSDDRAGQKMFSKHPISSHPPSNDTICSG